MNFFNEEQLETIEALARSHHQRVLMNPVLWDIPKDVKRNLEDQYVAGIIKGLTDPDYWKA